MMEYHSYFQRNEILKYAKIWMSLGNIMLSEKNRFKKKILYGSTNHINDILKIGVFIRTESRIKVIRGRGKGECSYCLM